MADPTIPSLYIDEGSRVVVSRKTTLAGKSECLLGEPGGLVLSCHLRRGGVTPTNLNKFECISQWGALGVQSVNSPEADSGNNEGVGIFRLISDSPCNTFEGLAEVLPERRLRQYAAE
jgi:hypothetical protein